MGKQGQLFQAVDINFVSLDREHVAVGFERAVGQQAAKVFQPDAGAVSSRVKAFRSLLQPGALDGAFVRGRPLYGDTEPVTAKFFHAENPLCVGRIPVQTRCNEGHGRDACALRQRGGFVEAGSTRGRATLANLFVSSPNGIKDVTQLIPVSEAAATDEFSSIKNQTRDDVLASLLIPPQNAGRFGSIREAAEIYVANELEPVQSRMTQMLLTMVISTMVELYYSITLRVAVGSEKSI